MVILLVTSIFLISVPKEAKAITWTIIYSHTFTFSQVNSECAANFSSTVTGDWKYTVTETGLDSGWTIFFRLCAPKDNGGEMASGPTKVFVGCDDFVDLGNGSSEMHDQSNLLFSDYPTNSTDVNFNGHDSVTPTFGVASFTQNGSAICDAAGYGISVPNTYFWNSFRLENDGTAFTQGSVTVTMEIPAPPTPTPTPAPPIAPFETITFPTSQIPIAIASDGTYLYAVFRVDEPSHTHCTLIKYNPSTQVFSPALSLTSMYPSMLLADSQYVYVIGVDGNLGYGTIQKIDSFSLTLSATYLAPINATLYQDLATCTQDSSHIFLAFYGTGATNEGETGGVWTCNVNADYQWLSIAKSTMTLAACSAHYIDAYSGSGPSEIYQYYPLPNWQLVLDSNTLYALTSPVGYAPNDAAIYNLYGLSTSTLALTLNETLPYSLRTVNTYGLATCNNYLFVGGSQIFRFMPLDPTSMNEWSSDMSETYHCWLFGNDANLFPAFSFGESSTNPICTEISPALADVRNLTSDEATGILSFASLSSSEIFFMFMDGKVQSFQLVGLSGGSGGGGGGYGNNNPTPTPYGPGGFINKTSPLQQLLNLLKKIPPWAIWAIIAILIIAGVAGIAKGNKKTAAPSRSFSPGAL